MKEADQDWKIFWVAAVGSDYIAGGYGRFCVVAAGSDCVAGGHGRICSIRIGNFSFSVGIGESRFKFKFCSTIGGLN